MLIQKNVKTTFRLNAGRGRSTVNGWSASYQILDKAGAVIFPVGGGWSIQDLREIGNGLFGVAITPTYEYAGYLHWGITDGVDTLYSAEPFTVVKLYGNLGIEQTFLANYGKSRTGKSLDFRILKDDLSELLTWSNVGVIELGSGMYGVVMTIGLSMTGYIEWRNNTDGLYVSDPIHIFPTQPVFEHAAPAISLVDPDINVSVNRIDITTATSNQVNTQVIDEAEITVSLSGGINIGVTI